MTYKPKLASLLVHKEEERRLKTFVVSHFLEMIDIE
jgi:hypothetical protein